jgi:5-methylcytosine-specific restriction endonuclease McrA
MLSTKTLMLNKNYVPIRLSTAYSVIGKFYCGHVEAIQVKDNNYVSIDFDKWLEMSLQDIWPSDQKFVNSSKQRIAVPRIVRCLTYDKIPKTTLRLTRKAIYERDNYTCYGCGEVFSVTNLTLDHIIPKSRGGDNSWLNLVTCCKKCNDKKEDKLLQELHWKPKFLPYKPNISNMSKLKSTITENNYFDEWKFFGV